MDHDQPQLEPRSTRPVRPGRQSGRARRLSWFAVLMVSSIGLVAAPVQAQPGGALKEVAFDQNLNAQIPLTAKFRDEKGQSVQLSDYFGKRPVVLIMGYSSCPSLCSVVLGEFTKSLKPLEFSIGKDFDVLTVSVNPKETTEQADGQRRMYLKRYDRAGAEQGWHSLTGDEPAIMQLAKAVGFRYTYSAKLNLYAHAAGFVLLTPAGRVSRYFYGVEYPAKELKYALMEASASKIGSPIDKLVMYCYDYDPATGKYTFAIMSAIRVLGIATVLALGTFMFAMVRRDRRMARAKWAMNPELPPGPAIP